MESRGLLIFVAGRYAEFLQYALRGLTLPYEVVEAQSKEECIRMRAYLPELTPFDVTVMVDVDTANLATDEQWHREVFDRIPHDRILTRVTTPLTHVARLPRHHLEKLGGIDHLADYGHVHWVNCALVGFRRTPEVLRQFRHYAAVFDRVTDRWGWGRADELAYILGWMEGLLPEPAHLHPRWLFSVQQTDAWDERNGFPLEQCRMVHAIGGRPFEVKHQALQRVIKRLEKGNE